jgi:hypothetical protein
LSSSWPRTKGPNSSATGSPTGPAPAVSQLEVPRPKGNRKYLAGQCGCGSHLKR